jgi:hypothetical protein
LGNAVEAEFHSSICTAALFTTVYNGYALRILTFTAGTSISRQGCGCGRLGLAALR